MVEPQVGMTVDDLVRCAKYAEKAGYGSFFRSDHILPTPGWDAPADSPECWVSLGAVAASTRSIAFGPMVSPIGFRNPALLARMACTLHSYSRGRLRLGVGAGWFGEEYKAHGMVFPAFGTRVAQLEEALMIIRPLTMGKRVKFQGKHYSADTGCLPKPRGKVHLILGGRSGRLVNLIAKYSDEWNLVRASPAEVRGFVSSLASRKPGRRIRISQMKPIVVSESRGELQARTKLYTRAWRIKGNVERAGPTMRKHGFLYGNVEEVVGQVNELREAGIESFYFNVLDGKDLEMMELLTHGLRTKL